jgi:hypothetical protein
MKTKLVIIIITISLLTPEKLFAFGLSSGRSVGMAGAYTSVAKGVESPFWNPANLGFPSESKRSWRIFSLAINAHNNSLSLQQYNKYNGKFLTTEDKQKILNSIPAEGLNASLEGDVLAFGFSDGRYAFTISGRGTSYLLVPKDPIEVLFFGNEINDTILVSDTDGEAFASIDFGFSHGRSVWSKDERELFCGINARYIWGLFYQKVTEAEGEVFALETGVNGKGNFQIKSANGGSGYGLDLGLALRYNRNWTFGLSFMNLVSQVRWNKKTENKVYRMQIDSLSADDFDSDSMIIEESYTEGIGSFTTRVPILLHVGGAYQTERMLLSLDLKQGFEKGMGISEKLRASLGAEYRFTSWLDVRGGIGLGGDEGITVANGVGFKLGKYHLDLGMAVQKGLWPTKSKGVSLAISNGFSF